MRRCLQLVLGLAVTPAVALGQTPDFSLDTLRVGVGSRASAALPLATRSVEVITAEMLDASPTRSVAEALAWALGADLQARSPAQADLAIRGGSFEQVLVLVDGVRASDAQTGHFDLDLAVPVSEIERIEILRGPATALYGSDAVGGVVNIVTRRGGETLRASVEAGSFGSAAFAAGAGVAGRAIRARIAGELRRSDGHRPGTDDRSVQARAALDLPTGDRLLTADLAFAARDFGARAFYTAPDAPFDEYEETRTLTASLGWSAPAAARLAIEPRLSARRHEDDFLLRRDDPDFYRNRHTSWQLGGELVARYRAAAGLGIVVGGEAFQDLLESTSLGDREETRTAAFVEAAVGHADRAMLNLGLRADWHSSFDGFVAPSLAAMVRAAQPLRLRASLGRAFRAPTWTDRFYSDPANVGDSDLRPERAWEAEIGADLDPLPGIRLGVAGFVRQADDLIDWARPTAAAADEPWRTRNVENALIRGIELEAMAIDLLGARWTAGFTALSLETEDNDGFTSKYALRPLTRTASIAVERRIVGDLSAAIRAIRARRADDEPYHLRSDLRVAYSHDGARLYVDLVNLTDERYPDVSGLAAPGRAAFIGVAWGRGER